MNKTLLTISQVFVAIGAVVIGIYALNLCNSIGLCSVSEIHEDSSSIYFLKLIYGVLHILLLKSHHGQTIHLIVLIFCSTVTGSVSVELTPVPASKPNIPPIVEVNIKVNTIVCNLFLCCFTFFSFIKY